MQTLTPQQRQTMQRKTEHELGYCDGLKFALDEWKKHDTAAAIRRARGTRAKLEHPRPCASDSRHN